MNVFNLRQNFMEFGPTYFYTETIQSFFKLLTNEALKLIVIDSLTYLVKNKFIKVYGFVIMPNHIHLIWVMLKMNGKESPAVSFAKYTAHAFRRTLLETDLGLLSKFESNKSDRKYQFWKRDALAIPLSSDSILEQKLEYIHNNPIKEKWNLCKYPSEYRWSSARFYEDGMDEFQFLSHYKDY